jgi:amino acid transporter, AAT family
MTAPLDSTPTSPLPPSDHTIANRTATTSLRRELTRRQLTMIVIGSAIGTGLFLGSGLAVRLGGPAAIVAYLFSAGLALMISWALAEMAVVHPTAGSLGLFAGRYLNPWIGFLAMLSYWAAAVLAIGQEIVAAGIYCQFWFPATPLWFWCGLFTTFLVWVNSWNVGRFGEFEYWFAFIKVLTILLFIIFGVGVLLGLSPYDSPGLSNYTSHGGFLATGWLGLWFAVPFALISFIGIELISVTAGEVRDPRNSIPRAARTVVWRLIIFYLGAMTVLLAITPWTEMGAKISPFVLVFQAVGVPGASSIMNFVVLTAALSGANASLYAATRMLYSMAQDKLVPSAFSRLSRKGVPLRALLGSAAGLGAATVAAVLIPAQAFMFMIAGAYFQIMLVWIVILFSYLVFRRRIGEARPLRILQGHPFTTYAALVSLFAILVTTWWIPAMWVTLLSGLVWVLLASAYYRLVRSHASSTIQKALAEADHADAS